MGSKQPTPPKQNRNANDVTLIAIESTDTDFLHRLIDWLDTAEVKDNTTLIRIAHPMRGEESTSG